MANTKKNFVVSCDSCADMPRSWYEKNDVPYLIMRHILNGNEISQCFETEEEFESFYEGLKRGDMPSTVALNPFETAEFFTEILKKSPDTDVIHIPLSSGLSVTCNNAISAADEVNKKQEANGKKGRVYVVDSLIATIGNGHILVEAIRARDEGFTTQYAIKHLEDFRDHQHGWVILSDLAALARGGRISPTKAKIASALNIRPIIHLNAKGKLALENKVRGNPKAIDYVLSRIDKYGIDYAKKNGKEFQTNYMWIGRTSKSELYEQLKKALEKKFPGVTFFEGIVGPVIGTHLGCNGAIVLFGADKRLSID